jgi:hypothetical protein
VPRGCCLLCVRLLLCWGIAGVHTRQAGRWTDQPTD